MSENKRPKQPPEIFELTEEVRQLKKFEKDSSEYKQQHKRCVKLITLLNTRYYPGYASFKVARGIIRGLDNASRTREAKPTS